MQTLARFNSMFLQPRLDKSAKENGFTLMEVMVTISCITILAAIAIPKSQGYFRQAHLSDANPYLEEIAEKERLYKITTGKYCCTNYTNFNEQTLSNGLGLSLSDAADFCLVLICISATLCEAPQTNLSFIVPADAGSPTTEFEVWAILRDPSSTKNVQGPGSVGCVPIPTKNAPTGWVYPSSATASAGRTGQVVVLRYPPPPNSRSALQGTYHNVRFTWTNGISGSDAMFP
ncbi:MAG: type IV pilin protein [Janthinobacterium lividum]